MGLTERHWFENEDVPGNYEWELEEAVHNSRTNKKHDDGIVRCKDCKHWVPESNSFGRCEQWHLIGVYCSDCFCADRERR